MINMAVGVDMLEANGTQIIEFKVCASAQGRQSRTPEYDGNVRGNEGTAWG